MDSRTELTEQESRDGTVRKGQPGQGSQDRIEGQDSQDGSARIELPTQNSQDESARTGLPWKDCLDRIEQPENKK
jgi:hypothetical protein